MPRPLHSHLGDLLLSADGTRFLVLAVDPLKRTVTLHVGGASLTIEQSAFTRLLATGQLTERAAATVPETDAPARVAS